MGELVIVLVIEFEWWLCEFYLQPNFERFLAGELGGRVLLLVFCRELYC